MKNSIEVRLSKFPGWHRGMKIFRLSLIDNMIYKLPIQKHSDKFCPQQNNIYVAAMNISVAETKLRKRADEIIKSYNESEKRDKKHPIEPTFIMT